MNIKALVKQKRVYIPFILVVLYTLTGFFILPAVSHKIITEKLSQALSRPVEIEKIRINPYALTFEVTGFTVQDKDDSAFVAADRLFANASILSLFTFSGVLSQLEINNPSARIVRRQDGTFNFSDLLNRAGETSSGEDTREPGKIPGFTVENLGLTGGRIIVEDLPTKVHHEIKDLAFFIPSISSKPKNREKPVKSSVELSANGSLLKIAVSSTPFNEGMATQVDINTGNIDLRHYLSYIPLPRGLNIESLNINLNTRLEFKKSGERSQIGVDTQLNILNAKVLDENRKDLVSLPKIEAQVKTKDVFSGVIHVPSVVVASPRIVIERDEEGRINLLKYIPQKDQESHDPETQESQSPTESKIKITLDRMQVADGRIDLEDRAEAKAFATSLSPFNFNLTGFKLAQTASGAYDLGFTTSQGGKLHTGGKFSLSPLNVDGRLNLSDFKVEDFSPYFETLIHVDLAGTRVNLETDYTVFKQEDALDARADVKQAAFLDIDIKDRQSGQSIVNVPELKVTGAGFHLLDRKVVSGKVHTGKGKIILIRDQNGALNLVPPVQSDDAAQGDLEAPAASGPQKPKPWDITLEELNLAEYTIDFTDRVPKDPVHVSLSSVSFEAADLHTTGDKAGRIKADMKLNEKGRISISGAVVPKHPSADLDVSLDKLDIKPVQPYFTESVKIMVTQGHINSKGNIRLNYGEAAKTMLAFSGEASLNDFVSLDKKNAREFFKCNSLYLSGVNVSLMPAVIDIRDVSLTDFYSLIRVDEDGRLNLSDIFTSAETTDETAVKEPSPVVQQPAAVDPDKSPPQIKVVSVTLQGGHLDFSDFMARPNFHATMKDIAGSLKGLSSDPETKAIVHLKGMHGNSSPLDIRGFINPLAEKKYADIGLTFKDIELSSFTPYAAKYLGYKIEKGKLILDLKYLVDGNALTSENRVRFDNFTLGESVQSEHATSLPVGLAISLLKDSDDRINLDLPVKGQLDDPEFKVGAIILKMVGNLVLKVVTSPFSIIGAMFGGGEDLGYVEFEFGDGQLHGSDTIKLDTLTKILLEKPTISLEIQGGYNVDEDTAALKQISWTELLKSLKFKEIVAEGSDITKISDVSLTPEEIPGLIETAYEAATFPKPRDEGGLEKILDTEEKKKLLITHINITDGDLRQLAVKRSQVIQDYLLTNGQIAAERIFLLEPKPVESKTDDAADTVKVTFLLK